MYKLSFLVLIFTLTSVLTYSQTVSVQFNVNLSLQIELENFDPENEFVDVAGSFNGWGSTLTQLSDTDNDSIYTATVNGFTIGETIAYKFRYNGLWDDREEFPGAGNDRTYTIQPDSNIILVWYNNEADPSGPPKAGFNTSLNSVFENSLVTFNDQSSGSISDYYWNFEGGIPEESSDREPSVRYPETGTYNVMQIVSNGELADTLFIEDYIEVKERILSDTKWWNESVFYEIFVRSFYDSDGDGIGDFNGLTEKLDYLNDGDPDTDNDLGITGIWLMPIHDSPSYHGYDVIDYRSINPDYGTMEDFRNFLDEAHQRGIRVIIDYVMNHTSTQHPWFQKSAAGDAHFRDFYRWSNSKPNYNGPWGQTVWHFTNGNYYYGLFWGGMPDLNYENSAVQDSMFAIADFWLSDVGIDGFRQDAVLYIDEDGSTLKNTDGTFQFWQDFNNHVKSINPDAFNVGEAWEPTDVVLKYISDDRLDYAFEFDLAGSILNGVNAENSQPILSQMQKVYDSYPFLQYGSFLTNHDQNRIMNVLGRDVDKAKIAASLLLTLPGIPYLYYGEEVGMLGQKPDEDIRLPMQWNNETNAGFTSGSPWRNPNTNFGDFNVEVMQEDENSLFNHYRQLIQIRNKYDALQTGELEIALSNENEVMAFIRGDENKESPVITVINLSQEAKEDVFLEFTDTFFDHVFSLGGCDLIRVFGNGKSYNTFGCESGTLSIYYEEIPPNNVSIFTQASGGLSTEGRDQPNEFSLYQNYPNPFNPSTNISFYLPNASNVQLNVYDITGRFVSELVNEKRNAGSHSVQFNAPELATGMYFYKLETEGFTSTKKMMLIK
ncbi:MAG: alpha-amylase family glycosyl hydrolase [Balneolaceae bacterium]